MVERKIRERRLEVLNRLLSHNLRNQMNMIEGHSELLKEEFEQGEVPESLLKIQSAATDLMGLAETVRKIARTTERSADPIPITVSERLGQLLSAFTDRYPDVAFDLTVPDDDLCEVAITGLMSAIEEAIENAINHNDGEEPFVAVRVERAGTAWLDITIKDNGPGIPEQEIEVLREGETPSSTPIDSDCG